MRRVVENEIARRVRALMTARAAALQERPHVAQELDAHQRRVLDAHASARPAHPASAAASRATDRRSAYDRLRRRRRLERERQLAVRVAAAAVGAHLARPHLMPGLRHVQHHAVAIERLERERRVGGDLGEEARVGIAFGIEDRRSVASNLRSGISPRMRSRSSAWLVNLPPSRAGRSCDACAAPWRRCGPPRCRCSSTCRRRAPCVPQLLLWPFSPVLNASSPSNVSDHDGTVPGKALALVEAARADEAERRAGGQLGMHACRRSGSHGKLIRLGDAVHRAVRHDRARPRFVVLRIVLDQHELDPAHGSTSPPGTR